MSAAAAAVSTTQQQVVAQLAMPVSHALVVLEPLGNTVLQGRRWPGGREVDCVLVGPGGVVVVASGALAAVPDAEDASLRAARLVAEELRDDLSEVGLPPAEVEAVVVVAGARRLDVRVGGVRVLGEKDVLPYVARRGTRLRAKELDAVVERALAVCPVRSTTPARPARPGSAVLDEAQQDLIASMDVQDAVFTGAIAEPLVAGSAFLAPEQARAALRPFAGPARLKGAAGSGKSLVGLHRIALRTSRRPGRVLHVSPLPTPAAVAENRYAALSPETAERVDFTDVHTFAIEVLRARGLGPYVDDYGTRKAYASAWTQVGKTGPLGESTQPWSYWQEEISLVIKGRGITRFEDYVGLQRVGRRCSLNRELRDAVWDLYVAYQTELVALGVTDRDDVLTAAAAELRRQPLDPTYDCVVVDDVQDLTCVAVRMLHALVGDTPDGLVLIGDAAQGVHPGGFTLTEAGVDVRGRSISLKENHRSTAQVLAAAYAAAAAGDPPATTRSGAEPVHVVAPFVDEHDRAMVDAVRAAAAAGGQVAVLVPSPSLVHHYAGVFMEHRLETTDIHAWDGVTGPSVVLGTAADAQGLEFDHVMLPQHADGTGERRAWETEDAHRERVELERRRLFVAMTRAREGLWLGTVARR